MGVSQPGIIALPRLLAVEVLLTEPESLGDDVLESCLYVPAIGFAARTATSHEAAVVPRRAPHGGLGLPTRLRADNRRF